MSGTSSTDDLHAAWSRFLETFGRLGHDAIDSAPNDADAADGIRFLLRQLAYREEQFLEFPSGHRAELFDPESPTRKVFADCPDTIYHQFSVSSDGRYRVTGTRGASPYISFTAYRAAVTDRVVSDLHDGQLTIADDGSFTLHVGGPTRERDWLDLGDDGAFVIIREYTHGRDRDDRATFRVEQLDPEPSHRPELDITRMSNVLDILGLGLGFVNGATVNLSKALAARPNVMNEAAADLVSEMAGTPHNHYQLCYVRLEPGQALELEVTPPACRYWSVHLNNWWLESPEYRDGQRVCLNDADASVNDDGTVTVLVGPDDPGRPNWLDTKGRRETTLLARYLLPESSPAPIVTRVITI